MYILEVAWPLDSFVVHIKYYLSEGNNHLCNKYIGHTFIAVIVTWVKFHCELKVVSIDAPGE